MNGTAMLSLSPCESNPVTGMEDAAALFQRDRDIDVRGFSQWETAQYGVAVGTSTPHANVGEIGAVPEAESVSARIHLALLVGTLRELIDLLQERDVGFVMGNDSGNPARVVSPVDAADALVNVVGEKRELHKNFRTALLLRLHNHHSDCCASGQVLEKN